MKLQFLLYTLLLGAVSHSAYGATKTKIRTASPSVSSQAHDTQTQAISNQTHTLALKCPWSDNHMLTSRVSVLNMGEGSKFDVALVTGHGLMSESGSLAQNCFVQDFAGRTHEVSSSAVATNYRAGTPDDWGLIKFKRIKTKNLVRYDLEATQLLFGETETYWPEVRFALARGLPENGQSCTVLPKKYSDLQGEKFKGILAHNCYAIGGQSGSPLSSSSNALLGFHLGTTWSFKSRYTGRPETLGYFRTLDPEMVQAIHALSHDLNLKDEK